MVSELSRLAAVVEALITLETFIQTDLMPQRPPQNHNASDEEEEEEEEEAGDSESAGDDNEVSNNSEIDDENCDEEDDIENGGNEEGRNEDDHREDGDNDDADIEGRETNKDHSGTRGNQSTLGGNVEGVGGPPHQTESIRGEIDKPGGQDGSALCIGPRA
jgi:hypothetical protein